MMEAPTPIQTPRPMSNGWQLRTVTPSRAPGSSARVAAKSASKSATGAPEALKTSTVRRAPEGLVMPSRRTWAMWWRSTPGRPVMRSP